MVNTGMNEKTGNSSPETTTEIRSGWHERLEAIHVAYHQLRQAKTGAASPHLWQKHAGKK